MNKYQEALNNLIRSSCPSMLPCKECNFSKMCNCEAKGWIDTLQELVDRATPKKYEEKEQIVNGISIIHAVCPNCGIIIDEFEHLKGCPYCLQALDWSGEEYVFD